MMKTLDEREGWVNRHVTPLPEKSTVLQIIQKDYHGESIYVCEWIPSNESGYPQDVPSKGYLGTARTISGEFIGIGFHAWEGNDSEFIYYSL